MLIRYVQNTSHQMGLGKTVSNTKPMSSNYPSKLQVNVS